MARGWESKSVEAQQEGGPPAVDQGSGLSVDERRRRQRLRDRELSRQLVLRQLAAATSEMRRLGLQRALAFLDEEIARLSTI